MNLEAYELQRLRANSVFEVRFLGSELLNGTYKVGEVLKGVGARWRVARRASGKSLRFAFSALKHSS